MSAITFGVIDQACEATTRNFFPPRVQLVTQSTTLIGTLIGFSEYLPSNPAKKYKKLTWDGSSEQQLWYNGVQIGGARFDYSGASEIDSQGNYLSLYTKELSKECAAADGLVTSIVFGSLGTIGYSFVGWCGPSGHEKCSPCNLPYLDVGNFAIGKGQAATSDRTFFWGSQSASGGRGIQQGNFVVVSPTVAQCVEDGTGQLACLFDPIQPNSTIPPNVAFFIAEVRWNHNYSATLSEEYTESDALANGKSYGGNSSVATNSRNGFDLSETSVVFTLNYSNLIVGQTYNTSYDLWDSITGITITVTSSFTAVAATNSVGGAIPIPARGHTTQIRNVKITFA